MRRAIALLFVIALGVDAKTFRVDSLTALEVVSGKSDVVSWKGRRAVHVLDTSPGTNGQAFVILRGRSSCPALMRSSTSTAPCNRA